jgi:hypothetical membrane protein
VRRNVHRGAGLIIFAIVQFVVAMIVVQYKYPGYSLSGNFVSDLGGPHSPWAWFFNGSIRVLGVLGFAGVALIRSAFADRRSSQVGLSLLALALVGAFLAGQFPEGSGNLFRGLPIHDAVSDLTFLTSAFGLLVLPTAMFRDTRWDGFRFYTFLSGLITLIAILLFAFGVEGALGPGGMERLIIAPPLLWGVVIGVHLLRLRKYAPKVYSTRPA